MDELDEIFGQFRWNLLLGAVRQMKASVRFEHAGLKLADWMRGLACAFLCSAAFSSAQVPSEPPSAPLPTAAPETESLTMFPHSDATRYWVSGQVNSIFQIHGHFHSPYEGPNSLIDDFETKASEVATLYLGYQLWPNSRFNTDLIVDFENAGGRGISQALGLAGETNVDVVRNPTLSTAPYLARGEIHQIFGLTAEMVDQDRGPLALATKVPSRRFEIRIGKMTLPDIFDVNSVGSDSHLQFTNWTIVNNGAWDYAADTRGYTVAGVLEYDDKVWSARYGIAAMPTVANGIDLDWAISRANGQNWEFELRKGLFSRWLDPKRGGAVRVLSFVNHAHMGDYRESVDEYLNGEVDRTRHYRDQEKFGAVKYGFGLNTEQEVTNSLRLFGRFGWNEDQHESYVYTEVGQTILFGGDYNGQNWGARTTRWAWRMFRTPLNATIKITCTTAGWASCWATAICATDARTLWSGITTPTSGTDFMA